MPDILSPEEKKQAKRAKKSPERKKEPEKHTDGRSILRYDFKHPSRVSKDQQRTLENLHSNQARMMASSYSTIQRSVVDVDIAFVDQTTYAEFIMSLSNPACSYTYTIEPLGGPAIFDFAPAVVGAFVDRQFGGNGRSRDVSRPITSIERTIMGKVVTRTLADLEATWEALLKIQVSDAELETNPEFVQVAAPSDTVILIAFEVNMQHCSGLISLCYPYFTLEPVMPYLNVQTWASRKPRQRNKDGVRQDRLLQLKRVTSEITAVCARGKLTTGEVADLRVGDTLVLDTRTDDPGVVFVADQPVFLARPGAGTKDNYAVELMQTIPSEEARNHV